MRKTRAALAGTLIASLEMTRQNAAVLHQELPIGTIDIEATPKADQPAVTA